MSGKWGPELKAGCFYFVTVWRRESPDKDVRTIRFFTPTQKGKAPKSFNDIITSAKKEFGAPSQELEVRAFVAMLGEGDIREIPLKT